MDFSCQVLSHCKESKEVARIVRLGKINEATPIMLHKRGQGGPDTDMPHTQISPRNINCLEYLIIYRSHVYEEFVGVDQSRWEIMRSDWGQACYYVTGAW